MAMISPITMLCFLFTALISFMGSMAAPECTEALCCHSYRHGYCKDNLHKAPVGNANPVAYTQAELNANTGDVICTTGYKDKTNKASIRGTTVAACCDQKTCNDLTCPSGDRKKSNPTQPTAGNEPTNAGCCEDITGMCTGNKNGNGNVGCTTGYKDKANKASISGNSVAACCDQKTCNDYTCPSGERKKSNPTQPTAGNEPTNGGCCEDITNMCSGNKQSSQNVNCPNGFTHLGSNVGYATSDNTDALKYAKCCMQPKCIRNVAAVTASCANLAVAQVLGTCNLGQHWTEKANIDTLPANPDWNNPGQVKNVGAGQNLADCCNPTTGKCTGNSDSNNNVACSTGYKDKANKASISGTTVAACCDQKTCSDNTCPSGMQPKSNPTQPTAGNEPTNNGCCEDITGRCTGNKNGNGDVACNTGYKDKANKASISGSTVAACCDQKTCNDLTCQSGQQKKSNPTQPTAGNEPTYAGCCEDITGRCTGNKNGNGNVACSTGYKDKANKASITGSTVAACCDQKTCSDLTCPSDKQMKANPTQPAAGNEPSTNDCCENLLKTCMNYDQQNVPYSCPSDKYVQQLATVASVTAVAGVNCNNDAFDVTAVAAVVGYGPVCPEPSNINQGTASPAARNTAKFAWYYIASGAVILTWCYNMLP